MHRETCLIPILVHMLIGLQQKSIKHMLVESLGPTEAVVKSEDLNKLTRARAKPSKKPENVDEDMGEEEEEEEEWEDMAGDEEMSGEEEEELGDEEAMDDEAEGEDTEVCQAK